MFFVVSKLEIGYNYNGIIRKRINCSILSCLEGLIMATIKIRNSKYYYNELKKIIDECARKNNVSIEEYGKIIELMSEKIRLIVKEKLSYRNDVDQIAEQFKVFMSDYLKQARQKGFFKENTIISNLTTLNSINWIGDSSNGTYGSAGIGFGRVDFNFNNDDMRDEEFRKEIFFHEITHHLINRNIDMQYISLSGGNKRQELQELERKLEIPVSRATTFLSELLTEEMAQQLTCNRRPIKTKVGVGEANLESNYTPPYNRQYQSLGTEFIKTVSECADYNEENMMKKAILLALDDNVDFVSIIKRNYQGKEGDLKVIFSTFEKVIKRAEDERVSYDEVENFFRITENNYILDYPRPTLSRVTPISIKSSQPSRIKIHNKKQNQPRKIRIQTDGKKQQRPHFEIKKKTTPQELLDATKEYAEEYHGEILKRKSIFERLFKSRKKDKGEK